MKKHPDRHKSMRIMWPWVLILQIIASLAVFMLLCQSLWLGGFIHGLCLWFLTPAAGFISACIATRRGLLNYIALLVPPLAQMAASLIFWGYLPQTGPVFLCGFVSLVGAATGEVLKGQYKR